MGASEYPAAMGSPSAWTIPLLAACAVAMCCFSAEAEAAEGVHQASGMKFPANIEGKLFRQELKEAGRTCSVVYATKAGHDVWVRVYPANGGSHGPSKLDGDERSGASSAFTEELDGLINRQSEGLKDATVVSRMRFQALAKNGPVGMRATVRGKPDGKAQNRELLLFERNGFFVTVTTRYPAEDWLKTGQTYTDVAHFIGWPATANPQASTPRIR